MRYNHRSEARSRTLRVAIAATTAIAGAGCATRDAPDYGSERLPHTLEIATERGCPTAVDSVWSRPCTGGAKRGDTCVLPGDWLRWSARDASGISIEFERQSPMSRDCRLSTTREYYSCNVAEDAKPAAYKYSVKLAGCERPLDPRVIVGTKK
ncbi:hypothetical protein BH24PSE2_BH24PSE2_05110 [soil metagenome]